MILTSKTNPKIKELKKLQQKKYRDQENAFLIEGYHLVDEALKRNLKLEIYEVLDHAKYSNSTLITSDLMNYLSTTVTPQNVVAKVTKLSNITSFESLVNLQKMNKVLVLNKLQDPGNIGTILRLAKAFDFDTVILEQIDPYNSKIIRSSQGALFDLNLILSNNLKVNLETLKESNFQVYETLLDPQAQKLNDVVFPKNKIVVVVGNEGQGISKELWDLADVKVYIPISFESLNVACATAIVLDKIRNR
ncbi:TrmH family RNA methyltransferase [Mycoplasmopsis gallopavonis]|uniref:tRNA/rRNA methyltransferase n=1 Tax=Mycoplasmopsis gallopavonis TaxID=76629 RepID=A0A449AYH3_9BACT|nr:RNA methyltransferase [Mycoplasmopsis gallopavonis]RIV16239.1 RNA methyltransferase [Mycoplasmopsis gallopavonis]VEU72550.1 tRNA/rRNA methyltransferase [Mycoplasmopsis gallopavonis]